MIEICRDHSANVKRRRDGQMALRWCAAGMAEAAKTQFRGVNGFLHLPVLRKALEAEVARITVTPPDYDLKKWPESHRGPSATGSCTPRERRVAVA